MNREPTVDDLECHKHITQTLFEARTPLVLVEWLDSAQPVPDWHWLDESRWGDVVKCRSVGWLIHDGEDVKALAQNIGSLCDDVQISGVIRIPACCITRLVRLVEGVPPESSAKVTRIAKNPAGDGR